MGGLKHAPLPPPIPPEIEYLWVTFCELDSARSCGMAPNPIPYVEMAAYAALVRGDRFERWELELLRMLDREYLVHLADTKPTRVR